ncbi:MAG: hypothetical protein HC879_04290 [Leptolyngbyaceae cyanobacterium SL_5_9]|nr:hypothetical protein [Leptolyngbyaceae cyanobacterium SL_5_9]
MTPQEITDALKSLFGSSVEASEPESWQVELDRVRLLVLLSEDQSWLRSLVSIAPAQEALPYLEQLLEANFDETQETRYALHESVLWGVFQHSRASLTSEDFKAAIARLLALQQQGLSVSFSRLAETQIRQIVQAAKLQGQSLEATLQTLDRFYQEGVMGEIDQNALQREQVLAAWRYQLERLWDEEI